MSPRPLPPSLPTVDRPSACRAVRGGLTDEEVEIARLVRALREEERELRRALAAASAAKRQDVERRIADLRARGRALMPQREAARRRRMALLGHEPE